MALPASDSFNRADGALGSNWTVNEGSFQIYSNIVEPSSTGVRSIAHWNADSFNNDQYAEGVTADSSSGGMSVAIGLAVRMAASADSCYGYETSRAWGGRGTFKLVNGSYTELGWVDGALANGTTIRLEIEGTTLTPSYGGTTDSGLVDTVSDLSSGYAGIEGYGNGYAALNSWEGGNLGEAPLVVTPGNIALSITGVGLVLVKGPFSKTAGIASTGLDCGPSFKAVKGSIVRSIGDGVVSLSGLGPTAIKGSLASVPGDVDIPLSGEGPVSVKGPFVTIVGLAALNIATDESIHGVKGSITKSLAESVFSLDSFGPVLIKGSFAEAPGNAGLVLTGEGLVIATSSFARTVGFDVFSLSAFLGDVTLDGDVILHPSYAVIVLTAQGPLVVVPITAPTYLGRGEVPIIRGMSRVMG